jgi:hypothetical protein
MQRILYEDYVVNIWAKYARFSAGQLLKQLE